MPADLKSILKLEVPLVVVIGSRQMAVREVLNLAPGAIVELPKQAEEELEVLVNNKPIGTGVAVKVGENFGVRVKYVGNLQDRIDALGSEPPGDTEPATSPEGESVDDSVIEQAVNDALGESTPAANAA